MEGVLIRGSPPGGAGSTNLSQLVISPWGWGFYTVRGGIDPGGTPFLSPFCCRCVAREDI